MNQDIRSLANWREPIGRLAGYFLIIGLPLDFFFFSLHGHISKFLGLLMITPGTIGMILLIIYMIFGKNEPAHNEAGAANLGGIVIAIGLIAFLFVVGVLEGPHWVVPALIGVIVILASLEGLSKRQNPAAHPRPKS